MRATPATAETTPTMVGVESDPCSEEGISGLVVANAKRTGVETEAEE